MRALAFLLLISPAWGNVPAAYFACEGAEEGASCRLVGGTFGNCVRDTLCEDPQDTEVNECLLCVDGCWATTEPGGSCIKLTGERGVCELQDRCTDIPETSFTECNRCVDGEADPIEAEDGCQSAPSPAWLPWLVLIGLAIRERR